MIIGYARVSSEGQSSALQLDALKAAGCTKFFEDKASGAKHDRPQLQKCLATLQRGDTLVCWKLDRLGRSLRHLTNIAHDLEQRGIDLVITTSGIDTRSPTGRLIFGILGSVAEFERSMIKERQEAGIRAAKARGTKFGPKRKASDEQIAMIRASRAKGETMRQISHRLAIPKSTIHNYLAPPKHCGDAAHS